MHVKISITRSFSSACHRFRGIWRTLHETLSAINCASRRIRHGFPLASIHIPRKTEAHTKNIQFGLIRASSPLNSFPFIEFATHNLPRNNLSSSFFSPLFFFFFSFCDKKLPGGSERNGPFAKVLRYFYGCACLLKGECSESFRPYLQEPRLFASPISLRRAECAEIGDKPSVPQTYRYSAVILGIFTLRLFPPILPLSLLRKTGES